MNMAYAMRILLRHIKTGQFYRESNDWTDAAEEALCFQHSGHAIQVATEQELKDAEILLAFGDPRYDIHLPLHKLA